MPPKFKRYVPPRRIQRNAPGVTIPAIVEEFATLYTAGWTLDRIARDTGWRPGQKRWQPGAYSPSAVRSALLDWGVVMRRPGGRGSSGRSILVRVADLERRMADMEKARSW